MTTTTSSRSSVVGPLSFLALTLFSSCGPSTTSTTPLVTSAGVPVEAAVTTSIDGTGGTLSSRDGRLTMVIAAGTVATATTFSIQPISSPAPNALGVSYRLEPHDVTFALPVTLKLLAPEAGISRTSVDGLGPASRAADGRWAWASDVTREGVTKTLTFTTTHFSDWSLLEGLQLRPMTATVQEGSQLDLEVVYCTETKQGGVMTGWVNTCGRDESSTWPAVEWSVNGQVGGSSSLGTVRGDLASLWKGTFTAPSMRPTPSTVTVSAALEGTSTKPRMSVLAELSIGAPGTFHGPITVTSTGGMFSYTASGDATLTPNEDDATTTTFDLTMSLALPPTSITLTPGVECQPTDRAKSVSSKATFTRLPPGLALALDAVWPVTCVSNGQTFGSAIALGWLTGCSPSTRLSLPVADPNHLEGTYTRSQAECGPGQVVGETTVTWNLAQEGTQP